jgi:hypothetical protein
MSNLIKVTDVDVLRRGDPMSDVTLKYLQREIEHVTEQLRIEHALTMTWKARALTAEQRLERLEKKSRRATRQPEPGVVGNAGNRESLDGREDGTGDTDAGLFNATKTA